MADKEEDKYEVLEKIGMSPSANGLPTFDQLTSCRTRLVRYHSQSAHKVHQAGAVSERDLIQPHVGEREESTARRTAHPRVVTTSEHRSILPSRTSQSFA